MQKIIAKSMHSVLVGAIFMILKCHSDWLQFSPKEKPLHFKSTAFYSREKIVVFIKFCSTNSF